MHLPNGHLLQNGKYKLANKVGQGGFGITYQGVWFTEVKGSLGKVKTEVPVCIKEYFFKDYCLRDPKTNAVKVHSETGRILFQKFKEKLIKEARILSHVHHPYIVNVLEVFEENDTAYIAMEYIPGFSLKERLEEEQVLSEEVVLRYIRQIGEALRFVHGKNVLHLDIKPSNILIDKHNCARLIDFGVSKRYDIENQETSTTILTLSKGFASIEQYDDEGTLVFSPCPDVYSLGATIYNLLTGKVPVESILRATKALVEPKAINPKISDTTNATIMRAMQIVPTDRFQTIGEMLNALDLPELEPYEKLNEERANDDSDAGDTTLIHRSPHTSAQADDDATILHQSTTASEIPAKRRKRATMYAILFTVIVLTATAVLIINKKPLPDIADNTQSAFIPDSIASSSMMDTVSIKPEDISSNLESVSQQPRITPTTTTATNQTVQQTIQSTSIEVTPVPSESEKDTAYESLFSSGKIKMEKANYIGAKTDFTQASEIKLTAEVIRLIDVADLRIAEQQIADRKAQYEEKMSFGAYKIVRKISNGKYGAIDNKGNEVITCKYQHVGRADEGRAFMRDDNLFDIYDTNGQKIKDGVANY